MTWPDRSAFNYWHLKTFRDDRKLIYCKTKWTWFCHFSFFFYRTLQATVVSCSLYLYVLSWKMYFMFSNITNNNSKSLLSPEWKWPNLLPTTIKSSFRWTSVGGLCFVWAESWSGDVWTVWQVWLLLFTFQILPDIQVFRPITASYSLICMSAQRVQGVLFHLVPK